jgi:acetyl esterase
MSRRRSRSLCTGLLLAAACAASDRPAVAPAALAAPVADQPRVMVYRTAGTRSLHAYLFEPSAGAGRRGAILLFHGGGWSDGSPEWVFGAAQRFAGLGMVAIPVEYRLADDTNTPIESLSDVCSAFQWVRAHARELRIDPRRVAGYGVSAGGHLLASTVTVGCPTSAPRRPSPRPDALVMLSPALDVGRDGWFRQKLKGRASPGDYAPLEHVQAPPPPTVIIQGADDTLTPAAAATGYCELVTRHGAACELTLFPGLGHLLTRNLKNQESDFDPDPEARERGNQKQAEFLRRLRFIH